MKPLLWEDGRPRTRGGPFDILYVPRRPAQPSPIVRQKQLKKAKQIAERDNAGRSLALSTQADADKQKRIRKTAV